MVIGVQSFGMYTDALYHCHKSVLLHKWPLLPVCYKLQIMPRCTSSILMWFSQEWIPTSLVKKKSSNWQSHITFIEMTSFSYSIGVVTFNKHWITMQIVIVPWGTLINDVPRFLAIFDLPTYLVLLYNVSFLGLFWTPPTYPNKGPH